MEKRVKPLGEFLPQVKLFPNDIKQLYDIFYKIDPDVILETEQHVLKDLDELFDLDEDKISNLTIRIRKPYISLGLLEDKVWLYSESDDYLSTGIFIELKNYLLLKKKKYGLLRSTALHGIIFGIALLGQVLYKVSLFWGIMASATMLFTILHGNYQDRQGYKSYSIIYLNKEASEQNFFVRKKDEIILSTIMAIIGALVGAFATYFLTKQ